MTAKPLWGDMTHPRAERSGMNTAALRRTGVLTFPPVWGYIVATMPVTVVIGTRTLNTPCGHNGHENNKEKPCGSETRCSSLCLAA